MKLTAARIRKVALAVALGCASIASHAGILYQVNRTIGAATLTGFIETDGTLGAISVANFTNVSLTLTGPDINFGAPSTISGGFIESSANLSATVNDLLYDFSGGAGIFFAFTSSGDFWCLATGGDPGCYEQGETAGYSVTTGNAAYVVPQRGLVSFASVATAVPEPGALALLGLGLGCLGLLRRRAA